MVLIKIVPIIGMKIATAWCLPNRYLCVTLAIIFRPQSTNTTQIEYYYHPKMRYKFTQLTQWIKKNTTGKYIAYIFKNKSEEAPQE